MFDLFRCSGYAPIVPLKRHFLNMSTCQISSILTTLTIGGGLGLLVLGLSLIVNLIIMRRGERLEMKPVG